MRDLLLAHEALFRLAAFAGVLGLMLLWEALRPFRPASTDAISRRLTNLGLSVLGALLVRLVLPVAAVGVALWAERSGFGLFNRPGVSPLVAFPVSFVALDLLVYGQHVAFHKIVLFWRLHRVHHADASIDATTGIRFHPFEILLSMFVKMIAVALLGAPAAAVIVFEIALNATAMFNHANVTLGRTLDPLVRLLFVTPDMHRVHHSIFRDEHDTNFGFNLSLWDRLFGTYRAAPRDGQRDMRIGLEDYAGEDARRLSWCLSLPFRTSAPLQEAREKER